MSPSITNVNFSSLSSPLLPPPPGGATQRFVLRDEEKILQSTDLMSEHPSQALGQSQGQVVTTEDPNGTGEEVLVKGEELCIVLILLLLWIGAIALFFNRWGKIRMLEPYQPKFCEAHRTSCPITTDVAPLTHFPRSFSKYNLSTTGEVSPHFAKCTFHGGGVGLSNSAYGGSGGTGGGGGFLTTSALIASSSRPRQNSVFVTSSAHSTTNAENTVQLNTNTRKAKSAIDLSTLVLSEEFFERVRRNSKNSVTQL